MKNNTIILAGGKGKRMKKDLPKPMLKVLGIPMLEWVIGASENENIIIVKGYKSEVIEDYIGGKYKTVLQEEQLGTGNAVLVAYECIKNENYENTLVLCGDSPFIDKETISGALKMHTAENNSVTVITADVPEPTGYGRIVRKDGVLSAIVEEKECTEEQKKLIEINSGAYWFKTEDLGKYLSLLKPDNSQGEYYLTDCISIALSEKQLVNAYKSENPNVALGANTPADLLELNQIAVKEIIYKHLEGGVEFISTDGIVIAPDVKIGAGTIIHTGCVIEENVTIGENCKIGPNVHIRPNSHIGNGVKIGNFVEVKNSTIGDKTSIAHLTYIGDSDVGSGVNFGCGCVTVNYDGVSKNRCVIGDNCFIGCNTNLVAPVKLGEYVYTGAGTTVTKDVPAYALCLERSEEKIYENYTKRKFNL
ncbi:MAG: NTP transferase domain-containing protein [Ruminococcus sp.]|jgi:bifunctional UDP-N-acetylglucosamine pyrophosphorylase/glucosamine-1-phosphate N-acetyltransferase|nr:NTP transferase domain-containing protein [Ruminococcus sp.]